MALAKEPMDPVTQHLNRDAFTFDIPIVEVRVPVVHASNCVRIFKKLQFDDLELRPRDDEEDKDMESTESVSISRPKCHRLYLDPEKVSNMEKCLSESEIKKLSSLNILDIANLQLHNAKHHTQHITYANCSKNYVLKRLLPPGEALSGYTMVGHIVHVNLVAALLPYKWAIGQLLLDKVHRARTVINKLSSIDSTYRHFQIELLAGESDYVTFVRENNCDFHMDFSKVYWNTRLGTEHTRLLDELRRGDVLYDACAGIGPFAVPAMKKACHVLANDLNPESVHWLKHNIVANTPKRLRPAAEFSNETWHPKDSSMPGIQVHQMDAMDFITEVALPHLRSFPKSSQVLTDSQPTRFFLVMNLPATATQFLSALRHVALPRSTQPSSEAIGRLQIRCYCFLRTEDVRETDGATSKEAALETAKQQHWTSVALLLDLASADDLDEKRNLRFVRNVAPGKDMFCATFELMLQLADEQYQAVDSKKIKLC